MIRGGSDVFLTCYDFITIDFFFVNFRCSDMVIGTPFPGKNISLNFGFQIIIDAVIYLASYALVTHDPTVSLRALL